MEKKFTFTWIIENFSAHFMQVKSAAFDLDASVSDYWYINLQPNSWKYDYVDVSLQSTDRNVELIEIYYRLEVLDWNDKNILSIDKCKSGEEKHLEKNRILASLIDDILILKFYFNQEHEANQQNLLPPLPYKDGLFADVLLRAGGAEFKVHKAMLQVRWPKLAEKLDAEEGTELLLDIAPNVLEAILKYVYTGKMDFSGHEFSQEVSDAAVKYELPHSICASVVAMTCRTQQEVHEVSFQWPIKNFWSLPINTELYSFSFNSLKCYDCYLVLHVSKDTRYGKVFDICLRKDGGWENMFVRSKISFDESSSSENEHIFHGDENWKCAEFRRTICIDPEDMLIVKCQFKFSMPSCDHQIVKCLYDSSSSVNCKYIRTDLGSLYQDKESADVDIYVWGGILHAHKFILSTRSPVFARMFESEMRESKRSHADILDADPEIISEMLEFLYTNTLPTYFSRNAVELYALAQKYDIPVLKKKCSYYLKSHLHTHNSCDVFQLADTHSDADLYDSVLEYINENAE